MSTSTHVSPAELKVLHVFFQWVNSPRLTDPPRDCRPPKCLAGPIEGKPRPSSIPEGVVVAQLRPEGFDVRGVIANLVDRGLLQPTRPTALVFGTWQLPDGRKLTVEHLGARLKVSVDDSVVSMLSRAGRGVPDRWCKLTAAGLDAVWAEGFPEILDSIDAAILDLLCRDPNRLHVIDDLEDIAHRETICQHVNSLITRGLLRRPSPNKGFHITEAGKKARQLPA